MHGIEQLEKELWAAADQLRANSKLTATEYSMPVLGLIFLRHAYNRFETIQSRLQKDPAWPVRSGKPKPVTKDDFLSQAAIYLPDEAQFPWLVAQPEAADLGRLINEAMDKIEDEYEVLKGALPKTYTEIENDVLRELLRIFNTDQLKKAEGDVFGRIYEYFLNEFAQSGAQEGGEYFTPMSIVQTIVNIIEPDHGIVFDPACGSSGMFVQSAYFIADEGAKPNEKVQFYGQEKAVVNTKLSRMNMAVHGLEAKVVQGNTFYEDHHDLRGKCDFVMANPPFNVDGVDAEKIKTDPRLTFGLPGVNKNNAVSNGNYLWISYFYSYLNDTGRAGFVMASSASDAGGKDREVRKRLIETGHVDVMMAIGTNFFYTRTLPCTLWFYDKGKPQERQDKVLMLDARNVYTVVNRRIRNFSPEQQASLIGIVWLYRGETERYAAMLTEMKQTHPEQAAWLEERFPDGVYADAPGLCKVVEKREVEANDWSLTPGRYVGVAPQAENDENFAEKMEAIHQELAQLDAEAMDLSRLIQENFEGLSG